MENVRRFYILINWLGLKGLIMAIYLDPVSTRASNTGKKNRQSVSEMYFFNFTNHDLKRTEMESRVLSKRNKSYFKSFDIAIRRENSGPGIKVVRQNLKVRQMSVNEAVSTTHAIDGIFFIALLNAVDPIAMKCFVFSVHQSFL